MPESRDLFVVVVGCGRLGSLVADNLSRIGHHVTVIDHREAAFDSLSPEYSGFKVEGDATEFACLREADVGQADVVIVVTESDNINLMVGQMARELFGVTRVIARVMEPTREEIFYELGVTTICPARIVGDEIVEGLVRDANGLGSLER
ncbi:MAG: TrkA family potassium uptake protein [Armatimonadia bacterium]|nr:TrkA family potassium uptake protein [Armatimonadia bacterium]